VITVTDRGVITYQKNTIGETYLPGFGLGGGGEDNFVNTATGSYPNAYVHFKADTYSIFLGWLGLSIRYDFRIALNFHCRYGTIWEWNELYPSFAAYVNGKNVYYFHELNSAGLWNWDHHTFSQGFTF
jgi:hypothetical protein